MSFVFQEPPQISAYSDLELKEASEWPAISRYLSFLERPAKSASDQLRLTRHSAWLRCALATYHDKVPAESVCKFWSHEAEKLIQEAWSLSGGARSETCVLALGKLGAEELNLSSDVDLILIRADGTEPDLKSQREFQKLLSEYTDFGFALRVDFDLRPGGRSSSVIPTISEFENHYGYHGEMWERLAYVRMRVLAGPANLAKEIKTFARKFSFRKHLDYTLLEELKALRSKIRSERFNKNQDIFHLKLGTGGIRELELFVHALQVMHGGRIPSLQTQSTSEALDRIGEMKLLPDEECKYLKQDYWYLRTLENRIQAFEDQQVYEINLSHAPVALSFPFVEELQKTTKRVSTICTSLFGESEQEPGLPEDAGLQTEWLKANGFSRFSYEETWPALLSATAVSRKSDRDERARQIFLRGFVTKLAENKLDRDLGLSLLLDFVRSIRAKASFFTLLNREPRVRDELATLFSISPYLGSILASRPELIDEYIYRKQAELSSDFGLLLDELAERRLLSELIAAGNFLADRDLRKLCMNISANADVIGLALLDAVKKESGPSDLGLITLGKWGGRELGIKSDLDFILISPGEPGQEDHRVAKRFISRMTEPHRGGSIYSIDMRLRPSGQSGPIMVRSDELKRYLDESAAAWERQAYLRSRPLIDLGFSPAQVASAKGLSANDITELRAIRNKLFAMGKVGEVDLKLSIGGLADVEFSAQIALLHRREFSLDPSTCGMIQYLESIDAGWKAVGAEILDGYNALREIEQLYQLTTSQSGSKMRVKSDEFRRLALVLDMQPSDLEESIRSRFSRIDSLLGKVRTLDQPE